jgi:hypothetical protein
MKQWNHVARMAETKMALKISTWNRVCKKQLRISALEDNNQMDLNGKIMRNGIQFSVSEQGPVTCCYEGVILS